MKEITMEGGDVMEKKLNFKSSEEFEDYMFETIHDVLEYVGDDNEKFESFCSTLYSVLCCEECNERFEMLINKFSKIIKTPVGIILLETCRQLIKERRKKL